MRLKNNNSKEGEGLASLSGNLGGGSQLKKKERSKMSQKKGRKKQKGKGGIVTRIGIKRGKIWQNTGDGLRRDGKFLMWAL